MKRRNLLFIVSTIICITFVLHRHSQCSFNNKVFTPLLTNDYTHTHPDVLNSLNSIIEYNNGHNDNYNHIFYPFLSGLSPEIHTNTKTTPPQPFTWESHKNSLSGTGIVTTVHNGNVDECLALINNLNYLNSHLPLQIVYREDELSRENLIRLRNATKATFINVSPVLSPTYANEYRSYYNKILAYVFNTFETSIIIDTDTVLFQSPESIMENSPNFQKHQTLFFKDRNLNYHMSDEFINLLNQFSPPPIEYTAHRYFHYMESGFFIVNRRKYFNAVKLTLHLPFFRSFCIASYGDKEMFWLAMVISGHTDFYFNENWSAAVGTLSPDNRICTSHPAHISSETNQLIWINSGVLNCPKLTNIDYVEESGFWKMSPEKLKSHYALPIYVDSYIIPPNYTHNKGTELNLVNLYHTQLCNGYIWCANYCIDDQCGEYAKFPEHEKHQINEIIKHYYNNLVI